MAYNYYDVESLRDQLLSSGGMIVGDPISEPDVVELQRNNWTVKCPPNTKPASTYCATWLSIKKPGFDSVTIGIYYFCFSKSGCNDPKGGAILIPPHEKLRMSSWGIQFKLTTVPAGETEFLVPVLPKALR